MLRTFHHNFVTIAQDLKRFKFGSKPVKPGLSSTFLLIRYVLRNIRAGFLFAIVNLRQTFERGFVLKTYHRDRIHRLSNGEQNDVVLLGITPSERNGEQEPSRNISCGFANRKPYDRRCGNTEPSFSRTFDPFRCGEWAIRFSGFSNS